MCNINLVMNNRKINDKRLTHIINVMSHDGYYINDDGQGFVTLKEEKKTTKYKLTKNVNEHLCEETGYLIMSHERASTSGLNDEWNNLQPIETNDFIILHNGILWEKGDNNLSDTHHLILDIQQKYIDEESNVIKLIKETMEQTTGSYSILLYHKSTNKLYYFKNSSTSFYGCADSNYTACSTNKELVEYAKGLLNINSEVKPFEDGVIYDVLNKFTRLAIFKPLTTTYCNYGWDSKTDSHGYYSNYSKLLPAELKSDEENLESQELGELMNNLEFRAYAFQDFMDYYYGGKFLHELDGDSLVTLVIPNGLYSRIKADLDICVIKNKGDTFTTFYADRWELVSLMEYNGYDWNLAVEQFKSVKRLDMIQAEYD